MKNTCRILFCIIFTGCLQALLAQPTTFQLLLVKEWKEHPQATIQDFYKFIFQSAMGPAHWNMSSEEAKEYLAQEIQSLVPDTSELLLQYLTPDSSLVRINLRPYLLQKRNIDSLAEAFYSTSQLFTPSLDTFQVRWNDFENLVECKAMPFALLDVKNFFVKMSQKKFPAVHHSEQYERAYHPSYRLILRSLIPN